MYCLAARTEPAGHPTLGDTLPAAILVLAAWTDMGQFGD
jgi:hypothetical protein